MRVGVMLPVGDMDAVGGGSVTWEHVREVAVAAEESGLDSVWIADHLLADMGDGRVLGMHDAWTLLSAVAAVTSRVTLGPLVMCSGLRHPSVIANSAVTLDEVAGGRLVLGLGAGWHDPEYRAFGFPTDNKVSRFEEALEIVARLLRGEHATFAGRYYAVDAALAPQPSRRIPILVAAKLPRMLRLTARWADAWNTAWFETPDDERFVERLRSFDEALDDVERSRTDVERTVGVVVKEDTDVPALLAGVAERGVDHAIASVEPLTADAVARLASAANQR